MTLLLARIAWLLAAIPALLFGQAGFTARSLLSAARRPARGGQA